MRVVNVYTSLTDSKKETARRELALRRMVGTVDAVTLPNEVGVICARNQTDEQLALICRNSVLSDVFASHNSFMTEANWMCICS